jgi:nucleotide-binding universal stress UspA family protein
MINVLIPTDFSENSWNAIEYGVQFFQKELVTFYLLHVSFYDGPETSKDAVAHGLVLDVNNGTAVGNQLQQIIDRIEALFFRTNHKFYAVQEHSLFIDGIKQAVEKKKIDFILMGTKGASGLKEVAIGSRTGEVITRVKCPTLVIPEHAVYTKPKRIVFPTDFNSYYKNKILLTLAEIISINEAWIHILHVTKKNHELSPIQAETKEFLDDFLMDKPHRFHFLSSDDLQSALATFIEDEQIDMIAMVAKNINFFQRLLFKPSVAKISYHTRIPFLVLHE